MTRVATKVDLLQGKQVYYRGYIYNPVWIDEKQVCICMPGYRPNSWITPYPSSSFTKCSSEVLPIGHFELLILD
ncbi:hypothetical protein I8752_13800 [Nostocaceae cyanobacterium CENA369]|uniref:Uncharacterized protein n=1 Tax=Dendronalium phyllosphericum CENA369 TaxID=1725256 RepID=A0A8J7I5B5_9NOST|nr:hypothetical protein [Dendronalium phyllosphericum]MBH8574073.1 hypothetical protein [Dendronalium phyllosphericum CENA369]